MLAVKPVVWLASTWYAPGYESVGWVVVALVAALFAWSVTSVRGDRDGAGRRSALVLLLAAAAVRLAAQLLAVNVIGALTLAVDVYALGVLAGLHRRSRAVSPAWLAALFCFALPLEPLLQRLLGYPLQRLSAAAACGLLQQTFDGVSCHGVAISLGGQDVLVDLPCSGAELLTDTWLILVLLAALRRPRPGAAAIGALIASSAAGIGNGLRIAALAAGTAHPAALGGLDLSIEPWHELTGLVFTAAAGAAVAAWACRVRPWQRQAPPERATPAATHWRSLAGLVYAAAALAIVSVAPRPVDVSRPVTLPALPRVLADSTRRMEPLSAEEHAYFERFGGAAERAAYGPFTLLVSGTRSPLRHLHAPDVCLGGAGHEVRYLGAQLDGLPSALYRSRGPDGREWRIRVSWVSDDGRVAVSVSQAVWLWLTGTASTWTMIQRITPWKADPASAREFEAGVMRALNLSAFDRSPTQGVAS